MRLLGSRGTGRAWMEKMGVRVMRSDAFWFAVIGRVAELEPRRRKEKRS